MIATAPLSYAPATPGDHHDLCTICQAQPVPAACGIDSVCDGCTNLSARLAPLRLTVVTSLRTAQWRGSKIIHALPEGDSLTTMCGRDASAQWIGNGLHGIEKDVSCISCTRAILRRPAVDVVVTTETTSGYAADHSQCRHTAEATDPFNHDELCARTLDCDCTYGCTCDCDCSLSDQACDDVSGRWLDGDSRLISTTVATERYDEALRAECEDLADYVATILRAMDPDVRYAAWRPSDHNAPGHPRSATLTAVRERSYDDSTEIETVYTLHLHGCTPQQRAAIFDALTTA